ncbi:uncharacterized protein [Aegilops tauschii subsp. strangulata]|uniref:uncharacterized protein n=1 Tax=Aegilops tauschii subsp. strangulata TaxID=200361 RepID=UPI003CC8C9DF
MAAANPAETPARRGVNTGVGSGGGLIPVLEWDDIKAKSRRILRRSTNRARCWERMKKRAKDLLHGSPEPGDEFVNEELVEYAYEDQAFDNSENLAVAGADDASADDGVDLKWEFDEERGRYYVSFPDDQ